MLRSISKLLRLWLYQPLILENDRLKFKLGESLEREKQLKADLNVTLDDLRTLIDNIMNQNRMPSLYRNDPEPVETLNKGRRDRLTLSRQSRDWSREATALENKAMK